MEESFLPLSKVIRPLRRAGRKTRLGGEKAKGEILAFIDDDAYPVGDWLKNIVRNFSNPIIVGVGGPGVTPPGVPWQEEASGWMSVSPLGAGPYTYRFLSGRKQFVDDYPSMNLSVIRSNFLAVGGFDSNYWPGEDTKLCLDLVNKQKKKIIYDPKVVVYHHRRPFGVLTCVRTAISASTVASLLASCPKPLSGWFISVRPSWSLVLSIFSCSPGLAQL